MTTEPTGLCIHPGRSQMATKV